MSAERCVMVVGAADAALLQKVLQGRTKQMPQIEHANSDATLIPLAKSWMTVRRTPVAIVMDADTENPSREQEMRLIYEDLLQVASGNVPFKSPFKLFLFMPDLTTCVEAILYEHPLRGKMRDHKVDWVNNLKKSEVDKIANHWLLQELVAFLDLPNNKRFVSAVAIEGAM